LVGLVVAPTDQPTHHSPDDGRDQIVAAFVVSEGGHGLLDGEDAMNRPEPAASDGDLHGRGGSLNSGNAFNWRLVAAS
jgi:hypothetical protein